MHDRQLQIVKGLSASTRSASSGAPAFADRSRRPDPPKVSIRRGPRGVDGLASAVVARFQSSLWSLNRVVADRGENEDWLYEVACEMETEHGVIWIRGFGDDGVMAFTDFEIESLINLIKFSKEDQSF